MSPARVLMTAGWLPPWMEFGMGLSETPAIDSFSYPTGRRGVGGSTTG